MAVRYFPVLKANNWTAPQRIPYSLISDHESQAMLNHGQSLATLERRGGLCPSEMIAVITNQGLWDVSHDEDAQVEATKKLWKMLWQ